MAELTPPCRLCFHQTRDLVTVDGRGYFACDHCGLRMMGAADLPDAVDEKNHYDQHENKLDDKGYQAFLGRLADPLKKRLLPASSLLDFGAGPGPALAAMMRDDGHDVAIYDPFYAPDASLLSAEYDAVMATEVVEHFHHPHEGFKTMLACVRPGGWLAIMTNLQDDDAAFAQWYYRRDPTHVAFYREETFQFIGRHFGLELNRVSRNVTFFQKPE